MECKIVHSTPFKKKLKTTTKLQMNEQVNENNIKYEAGSFWLCYLDPLSCFSMQVLAGQSCRKLFARGHILLWSNIFDETWPAGCKFISVDNKIIMHFLWLKYISCNKVEYMCQILISVWLLKVVHSALSNPH